MKKITRRSFFSSLAAAVVGVSLAASIPASANNTKNKEVDIQELFDNGFDPVMHYNLQQHLDLIEKIKKHDILEKKLNETQVYNVSRYFVNIPDSACMKMWHTLCIGIMGNSIAVHQFNKNNVIPSHRLGDIIGNKDRYAVVQRELNLPC